MTWPTEQAREAVEGALRKSRLTWGTHSDRWSDVPWQRDFWGEAADIAVAALAPHVAALVRAERAAALREAAEAFEVILREHRAAPDAGFNDFVVDAGLSYAVRDLRDRADAEEAGR